MTDTTRAGTTEPQREDGDAEATGTRTEAAADGDARVEESTEDVASLRRELARLQNANEQLLAHKNNWEADREELDDYRRRVSRGPLAHEQQQQQPDGSHLAELEDALLELRVEAKNGDRRAALQLATLERQYEAERRFQQQLVVQSQFARIPQEDHADVVRYLQTGEFATPAAAYKAFKGDRLERELKEKTKELKEREEQHARKVVATDTRGVPANEAKARALNSTDFAKEWDAAAARGDTAKRAELLEQWRTGKVRGG